MAFVENRIPEAFFNKFVSRGYSVGYYPYLFSHK